MKEIVWLDSYNTGNDEIDSQHKKLFAMLKEHSGKHTGRLDEEEIRQVLADMIDYAQFHFQFEEKFLADKQFHELDEHIDLHKQFWDHLAHYCNRSPDLDTLLKFLTDWIADHITNEVDHIRKLSQTDND